MKDGEKWREANNKQNRKEDRERQTGKFGKGRTNQSGVKSKREGWKNTSEADKWIERC